jgi:hypothetical protein
MGDALQARVVSQKTDSVGAEFEIAFKHAVAMACSSFKSTQGVFWCQGARTAMGHPKGARPRTGGHTIKA